MGAPIRLITPTEALAIEPGLNPSMIAAAFCELDGHVTAYLTGRAYRKALVAAGAGVFENTPVTGIAPEAGRYVIRHQDGGRTVARRLVLAGGVWLETMLGWLGIAVPIKCLVNQLIVTERMAPVMRSVVSIANGLLSLKQFENGTVLIGGGWQGIGDREDGPIAVRPENLIGNLRLAAHTIPALRHARAVRAWLGLEAETDDALPALGPLPGVPGAWIIGSVHSGYTSGPFMGKLLAQAVLGQRPDLPLFPVDRLLTEARAA